VSLACAHRWDLSAREAMALQAQLADRVVVQTTFCPTSVRTVAGVDVGFHGDVARAAVVVLGVPGLEPLDGVVADLPVVFPYVPGLLAFREGPVVLRALEQLKTWPDLWIFDAHGIAHQRRLGLAAHLGLLLDAPSIGCAKSRLAGQCDDPPDTPGAWAPLQDNGQTIGAALRTGKGFRPVYVSIGHRVDLLTAIDWVLRCTHGHRLPETTRWAHKMAAGAQLPGRPRQELRVADGL
jgi:deoxyribonuclease V